MKGGVVTQWDSTTERTRGPQKWVSGTEHPGRDNTKRRNSNSQITKNGSIGSSPPGTGWVHDIVSTAKKWAPDKRRRNSDTRPTKKAAKQFHSHSLTPQELRYKFQAAMKKAAKQHHSPARHKLRHKCQGSDQFTVININHAAHQYRVTIEDLDRVVQMEEDIAIHGEGKEHDKRLKKFLARLQDHGLTLRKEKCKFGVAGV